MLIKTDDIPAPPGRSYLPFQQEGILEMLSRSHVLLADDMGLGKTIQCVGLINARRKGIMNVLIVCPASLKLNWATELKAWLVEPMEIYFANGSFPIPGMGIVIVNYEQVRKHRKAIDCVDWDLLICDESHFLKTATSLRTASILGRWVPEDHTKTIWPIKAKQKIFCTGTPILNRPKEIWTTVRALDKEGLGRNRDAFMIRYCNAHPEWVPRPGGGRKMIINIDGASNLSELNEKLRAGIMIRRKKEDVLPQLPPKRRQVILIPASTPELRAALDSERRELDGREAISKMERARKEVESLSEHQTTDIYKRAVTRLEALTGIAFNDTARVRKETALAKIPQVIDHLKNVLEAEPKVVVFTHHHDVTDAIVAGLEAYSPLKIDGRDPPQARQMAVDTFQLSERHRIMVGSIGTMGLGLTLTAASYAAFAEISWVPGELAQAEDRLRRIGQPHSVLIQQLLLEDSFDGNMAKTVLAKMAVVEAVLG